MDDVARKRAAAVVRARAKKSSARFGTLISRRPRERGDGDVRHTHRALRHGPGPREAFAHGRGGGERQDVRARQEAGRVFLQGVPGERDLRAREAATQLQGVRRLERLRAREGAKQVQGVRGLEHLRARDAANPVQGVRGREHLRAREAAKPVQGMRGLGHLRAREAAIQLQGVPRGSQRDGSRALPPRPTQARDFGRARGRGGPG